MYLRVLKYRMTFWPNSRNRPGNWVEVRDMLTWDRLLAQDWRPHICKVLPGCIIVHSKTPANLHTTDLAWDWCGCAGAGMVVRIVGRGMCLDSRYFLKYSVFFLYVLIFSVVLHDFSILRDFRYFRYFLTSFRYFLIFSVTFPIFSKVFRYLPLAMSSHRWQPKRFHEGNSCILQGLRQRGVVIIAVCPSVRPFACPPPARTPKAQVQTPRI